MCAVARLRRRRFDNETGTLAGARARLHGATCTVDPAVLDSPTVTPRLTLYGIMALSAFVLHVAFGGDIVGLVAPGPAALDAPVHDIAAGIGFGLFAVALYRLGSARFRWIQSMDAEFREYLRPLSLRDVPMLAVASAVAEELFFRGFLQPRLGFAATSVLFGLTHIPARRNLLPWPVIATAMGFAFGALYMIQGSLLAPVLAHFTINFLNLYHYLKRRTKEAT